MGAEDHKTSPEDLLLTKETIAEERTTSRYTLIAFYINIFASIILELDPVV